jgi:hypothetical protein
MKTIHYPAVWVLENMHFNAVLSEQVFSPIK